MSDDTVRVYTNLAACTMSNVLLVFRSCGMLRHIAGHCGTMWHVAEQHGTASGENAA